MVREAKLRYNNCAIPVIVFIKVFSQRQISIYLFIYHQSKLWENW